MLEVLTKPHLISPALYQSGDREFRRAVKSRFRVRVHCVTREAVDEDDLTLCYVLRHHLTHCQLCAMIHRRYVHREERLYFLRKFP